MRILLVYPNVGTRNGPHYPHGLGALAAVAARAGHEVRTLLPTAMPDESSFLKTLSEWPPELAAFSFSSHQWKYARRLMGWTRRAGVPVLAGGVHASFAADEVLASGACDWVCVGEGEGALLDLAAGGEPATIANVWGDGRRNAPRPLLADLDELPVYDRRHFPQEEINRANGGEVTVVVGRGCPYPCTYCCNGAWRAMYAGQPWVRWRTAVHLFAELDLLRSRYAVDSFYFEDDIFTLRRDFLEDFLSMYPRRIALPFRAYFRVGTVKRDDLRRLREAGLAMANVGIEHGDETIRREVLRRDMGNAQIADFFAWCRELGIRTRAFHIVGVPGETPATLQATRELCARVAPDEVQISLFEPYPGTALYDRCRDEGTIKGVERATYFTDAPAVRLRDFPEEDLTAAYRDFCAQARDIEEDALRRSLAAQTLGDIDLVAQWSPGTVRGHGAAPAVRKRVRIGAQERFCLFAHPRSEIVFPLPAGRYRFRAWLALDPLCLEWGGNGATFALAIEGREVWSRFIDPKHRVDDRGWQAVEVELHLAAAGELSLITRPDTSGELTALWALWGHPHLWREGGA